MAKVSVIIPLYKSERFIAQALDSVLSQTHGNLEVLCVDDCSPDKTAEIVAGYQAKDERVVYIAHTENKGAPAFGRNTGLEKAKGDYVTFLDHDDSFLPAKLEELLAAMAKEEVDFICSNIFLVNDKTGRTDGTAWGTITGDAKAGFAKRLLQGNFVPPNSTLIRRRVFDKVGVFDTSLKGVDDFDLWFRISRHFPATVYPKPLATWRYQNTQSISANSQLMISDERAFYEKIAGQDEFTSEEKEMARQGIRRADRQLANRLLLAKKYKEAASLYHQAGAERYAKLAETAPGIFRQVYIWKRRTAPEFSPLNLDFS